MNFDFDTMQKKMHLPLLEIGEKGYSGDLNPNVRIREAVI